MPSRPTPLVIGVLGGIGSGKSAVAHSLSQYFQTLVLDADKVGHELLGDTEIQEQILTRFGQEVFAPNGQIDRRALASKVFGIQPVQQQARLDLNRILHPKIKETLTKQISQTSDKTEVVVLDAAVMLEAGWNDLCQAIVFVDAPWHDRLARVQQRGWSESELRNRESSQVPLDEKRRRSTAVIDNSGTLDEAVQQFRDIIHQLKAADSSVK